MPGFVNKGKLKKNRKSIPDFVKSVLKLAFPLKNPEIYNYFTAIQTTAIFVMTLRLAEVSLGALVLSRANVTYF